MIDKKIHSFRHALRGVGIAWREESNFKLEILGGAGAIILSFLLQISRTDFIVVLLIIGFVLATEILNTALEEFCDMVKSDPDPHVAKIKDLAAAAVLVSSITAAAIGGWIFIPYVLPLVW